MTNASVSRRVCAPSKLSGLAQPTFLNTYTMLVIRLARIGRSRRAAFRLVVQEKTKAPKSDSLEIVGSYNPLLKTDNWVFNKERITYYLSKGAQPSATVNNALIVAGIVTGTKQRVVGRKKGALAKEKADVEAASKTAAEAKKADAAKAAEAAAAPAETPAPEAPENPPKVETPTETPPAETK